MSRMEVGTFINDRYTAIEERLQIVRKRLNRPLSFSEKVTPEALSQKTFQVNEMEQSFIVLPTVQDF